MQESNNLYDDEIRLKTVILKVQELKNELVSRWKVVFIFSTLFAVLGVLYAMKKQTTYKAELNFVVEDNSRGAGTLGKYSGLASQFGFDFGGGASTTFSEGNILELLTSRRVVEAALLSEVSIDGQKDLLINYHTDFNNYREKWAEKAPDIKTLAYHYDRSRFTLLHDSILAVAWRNLTGDNVNVQLVDESNIISVSCKSKNELFAKLLVEELVAEVKEYYTHTQTAKARHTLDFIQNRADSVLNELKLAELSYARHRDSNFGVMRAEGLLEELRLKREVEILNVMYGEIIKNLEISKVTLLNQKPLINVIDSPRFPLEVVRFSMLKGIVLFAFLGAMLSSMYVLIAYLIRDALEVS
tara:strand:- start:231 stop:1301 length:1071 start_codon:yes stop_codon:yes gene_type:complete